LGRWAADRDADLNVDPLRAELVVAAVRRSGGLDPHVGQPVRDVREVLVEQRGEIELAHRLRHAGSRRRLRGQLADLGLDHRCGTPRLT